MEKKIYERPVMMVEMFVPNRYCATCSEGADVWVATCRNGRALIFYGGGEDGPDDWESDACRGGCGKTHEFKLEPGTTIGPNCWIITSVQTGWGGNAPSNYPQYFTHTHSGGIDGSGWTLNEAGQAYFRERGELLPAYYNNECLDGGSWLVTEDLMHIHPTS